MPLLEGIRRVLVHDENRASGYEVLELKLAKDVEVLGF